MTVQTAAALMVEQLESTRLEVALLPAPDPRHAEHMIRRAISLNPPWYREFCRAYPSSRKDNHAGKRTRIKRRETLDTLCRLADGDNPQSIYTPHLEAIAARIAARQPF